MVNFVASAGEPRKSVRAANGAQKSCRLAIAFTVRGEALSKVLSGVARRVLVVLDGGNNCSCDVC